MIEMKRVPRGTIHMKDDRNDSKWTIKLEAFLMGVYPVTNEQYNVIQGIQAGVKDGYPVTDVSWYEVVNFCNALSDYEGLNPYYNIDDETLTISEMKNSKGYSLPTEAEWEFACRGGSQSYRYGNLDDIAWHNGNSGNVAHKVGLKLANSWGLFDMLGNVWEWCNCIYDIEKYGIYRTFRGGSWADEPRASGASCRRRSHPTAKLEDLGFRVCRSV